MHDRYPLMLPLDLTLDGEVRSQGFCNFLGTPSRRFSDAGDLQRTDQGSRTRMHERMKRLAWHMARADREIWTTPLAPECEAWENPRVPSGYTYLLQLVAHDLVDTVISVLPAEATKPDLRNARRRPLMLDTIYGSGPDECPHAYVFDAGQREPGLALPRTRLRVRKDVGIEGDLPLQTVFCGFHDIARSAPREEEAGRQGNPEWPTDVLIADPRNDAHALMSQLTVLFHEFHNTIVDLLGSTETPSLADSYRQYLCSRFVVAMIYREIVANDLMAKVLHPEVFEAYRVGMPPLTRSDGIPFEFSHGAFRFGHAMVRDAYAINRDQKLPMEVALSLNSRTAPGRPGQTNPIDRDWVVDWARFFDFQETSAADRVGAIRPNLSRKIGPRFANVLLSKRFFKPKSGEVDAAGLADRDLLSACYAGVWSVPELVRALRSQLHDHPLAELVPEYETAWRPLIQSNLTPSTGAIAPELDVSADDAEKIAEDPPLPFFVLFEAAFQRSGTPSAQATGGSHLGPVGSIIVADTIFGALRSKPFGFDELSLSLPERIEHCCKSMQIDARKLGKFFADPPRTMPQLIAALDGTAFRGR